MVEEIATPEPEPTPETIETIGLGEEISTTAATITIDSVETVDSLPSQFVEILPEDGQSLHLLTMNWTNTGTEAVQKVCFGPDTVDIRVYDQDDREMLFDTDSGHIEGNECSSGLMSGQTGLWLSAYQGLADSTPTYAVITDYLGGEDQYVALAEGVELSVAS